MTFGSRTVLDGVSFRINKGDKIALIGDNGVGKSTLFKIIKSIYTPDSGKVVFHGNTIAGFLSQNMDEMDLSVGVKPQNLIDLEIRKAELERTMSDNPDAMDEYAKVSAEYESLGGYDYEHRLSQALAGLGFKSDLTDRDLTTLSGGEKMRLCLARLIVERPDVLMLDEPTNHLDVDAIEWLENFLSSYGGAVFVITHDRHFIDSFAQKIIELDGGKIREWKGNYSAYVVQKQEFLKSQTAQIEALEKSLEHELEVKQTYFSHRNMSGYHQKEKTVDKLTEILQKAKSQMPAEYAKMNFEAIPKEREGASDKILLKVTDCAKSFSDTLLFSDISFELKADEKIFLCGPNGCGKTTLLNMLLGKLDGMSGTVLISQTAQVGYMGQFVPFENDELNCFEELTNRCDLTITEARSYLARFGFKGDDVFKKISVLSGGEKSRLYLCCLLRESPDILFLDEPTNHLDIESREILEDALKNFDGAIVCVSHDRYFIDKCADKILGFANGTAKLFDTYEYYRKSLRKPVEAPAEKKEDSPKNKASLRRENAKRRQRISDIEKLTEQLETRQKELEDLFVSGAGESEYKEYADNDAELKKLYEEYFSLCED